MRVHIYCPNLKYFAKSQRITYLKPVDQTSKGLRPLALPDCLHPLARRALTGGIFTYFKIRR